MIRRLLSSLPKLFWFLPGFLLWASFPPMAEKMDVFFALAPLLWFARHRSPGQSLKCFFCNGLVFWVGTLSWMPAIIKNGGPSILVFLGWLVLAAYCALYFGVFGYLSASVWQWVRERSYGWRLMALLLVEPVLWAGLELIRSRFGGGFAWNQLGVAPINGGLGAPAALGGVYLVSMVVILVNGTFASIADRMLAPLRGEVMSVPKWLRSVETLLPLLLVLGLYCLSGKSAEVMKGGRSEVVSFGLMQRNFPCVFQGKRDNPIRAYLQLIKEVTHQGVPDVLVLPESAFCERWRDPDGDLWIGDVDSAAAKDFADVLMRETYASAVIAGGARQDAEERLFNSIGVYSYAGEAPLIYDKVHLVPFGEYIPGDKWITALQALAPVGSCTPGELKVLPLTIRGGRTVAIAPAICYEDTDSAQIRELVAQGAEVIVVCTNDSWFSHSIEALQHAWQSVARAVETGRPVVRVGNSGVSGKVDSDGSCQWLSDEKGRPLVDDLGAMRVRVALGRGTTVYTRWGDVPLLVAFILLIMAIGVIKYHHDYEKRRTLSL